jgi:hypothetical protein
LGYDLIAQAAKIAESRAEDTRKKLSQGLGEHENTWMKYAPPG